jgi:uncharacterized protein (DUF1697 family)
MKKGNTTFIALLRGINVGGSGILPMKDLIALCSEIGCSAVRTYIQSGNVVFESSLTEADIRRQLEAALAVRMEKKIEVMVRTRDELRAVLDANPFVGEEPAKTAVAFLHQPPPADLMAGVVGPGGEQVRLGRREIYIYYPNGMGRSKLKIPLGKELATVRNINTLAKLVEMAEGAR